MDAIRKDGLAPGLDEYLMGLELDENMREKMDRFGKEKENAWDAVYLSCANRVRRTALSG